VGLMCAVSATRSRVAGAGMGLASQEAVRFMLAEDLLSLERGTGY